MIDLKLSLPPDLVQVLARIDEFKGRWLSLEMLSPDRLAVLRKVATVESIGSSTRIEGSSLSDAEVENLLDDLERTAFLSRDEQEVAGYAQAMDLVFEASSDLRLTENHLRQLHQTLLRFSDKDERHRGSYKVMDNHVVAFDEHGKQLGVIFHTATPFDTPREMEELVAWTTKALAEESMHPLLIIAIFVVVFLAIHPFQDGNGRLSRVLTTLLLLRAGYGYVPYASLEGVIEENKEFYYRALRRTQKTLQEGAPDWEPWIGFFLRCLKTQQDNLAYRLQQEQIVESDDDADLPVLSVQVLSLLGTQERLTIEQIRQATGANRNTLKLRLRELVADGRVHMRGKARATWYTLTKR